MLEKIYTVQNGPLQLSTDKHSRMFSRLKKEKSKITSSSKIKEILSDTAFTDFDSINVLPLIYDEKKQRCNILVFDYELAKEKTVLIKRLDKGRGRKHPVYRFYDTQEDYICEVRYGGASANALQRGLWTHTRNGIKYFDSITNGWIDYSHNLVLVKLFSHTLVSSSNGHSLALEKIKEDIEQLKKGSGI